MPKGTEHGEIWWAAADKRRPVLVVSRDDPRGARALATVAAVTRTARGLPSEVELDERDGLPRPCVVNCDDLTTLAKARLIRDVSVTDRDRQGTPDLVPGHPRAGPTKCPGSKPLTPNLPSAPGLPPTINR